MDIETLTKFFMWCTIVNGSLLIITSAFCMFGANFGYRIHSKLFHISREAFNVAIFSFLGLFKIFFITFNIVPYVALLIIG